MLDFEEGAEGRVERHVGGRGSKVELSRRIAVDDTCVILWYGSDEWVWGSRNA